MSYKRSRQKLRKRKPRRDAPRGNYAGPVAEKPAQPRQERFCDDEPPEARPPLVD